MEPDQQEALDQQVQQVMQELGETASVETVARTIKRRTADVLDSLRRLTRGTPEPAVDVDLAPEQSPEVLAAARRMATIEAALGDAEQTLQARETALARAETAAAEALIDGREPSSLVEARQAVLPAAAMVHLLELAQTTAKTRHTEALELAETRSWRVRWRAFQMDLAAFDAALAEAYEAQVAVLASWNACGQPGQAPLMRGPLSIWESDFHAYVQDLVATPAEAVQRGMFLPAGGQPRAY